MVYKSLHSLMPEIRKAAAFSHHPLCCLSPHSYSCLSLSTLSLTPVVVGVSKCLYRDMSPGKHKVKECMCLIEEPDSSTERCFKMH